MKAKKEGLLKEANILIATKKKLYSNMDIESAMSEGEKEITKKIADIFSEVNKIVREIRNAA